MTDAVRTYTVDYVKELQAQISTLKDQLRQAVAIAQALRESGDALNVELRETRQQLVMLASKHGPGKCAVIGATEVRPVVPLDAEAL